MQIDLLLEYCEYLKFKTMKSKYFEFSQSQGWFIERMQKLGYRANSKGMCYGLSAMASQAVQCGLEEYALFKERLKQIALIPTENFAQELEQIKAQRVALFHEAKQHAKEELQARNAGNNLTPMDEKTLNALTNEKYTHLVEALPIRDRARLTINNFLDGVELYMQPINYPELFQNQLKAQTSDVAAPLLLPPQLQQKQLQRELPSNLVFSGSYDPDDLYSYLEILQQKLKDCQNPVSLRLYSINHAVCLVFDPNQDEENCWSLFDANYMKDMDITNGIEAGDSIYVGLSVDFNANLPQRPSIQFSTFIAFFSNEDKEKFLISSPSLTENAEWMKMHSPREFNSNWLNIAINIGDINAIKKFLDLGINKAQKNSLGLDYLEDAIIQERSDIVRLFLEKMSKSELLPKYFIWAIERGNLEIVKIFLEAGFDPLQLDFNINNSPLSFAEKKASFSENTNTVYQEIYETIKSVESVRHKSEAKLLRNENEQKSLKNKLIDIKAETMINEPEIPSIKKNF